MNRFWKVCLCLLMMGGIAMQRSEGRETAGPYVYEGAIVGVMCHVCAQTVKGAVEKVDGVTAVKIVRQAGDAVPRLRVEARRWDLTKAEIVKALGDDAKQFQLQAFTLLPRR